MKRRDPPAVTFIVDENMGSSIVDAITACGGRAELLTQHVERGTEDVEFIPNLSRWGNAFLTRDLAMNSNEIEQVALKKCDVHVFLIRGGGLKLHELIELILEHRAAMERYVQKYATPFVARVSKSGITVLTKMGRRGGVKK